jgi:hypothetical protein
LPPFARRLPRMSSRGRGIARRQGIAGVRGHAACLLDCGPGAAIRRKLAEIGRGEHPLTSNTLRLGLEHIIVFLKLLVCDRCTPPVHGSSPCSPGAQTKPGTVRRLRLLSGENQSGFHLYLRRHIGCGTSRIGVCRQAQEVQAQAVRFDGLSCSKLISRGMVCVLCRTFQKNCLFIWKRKRCTSKIRIDVPRADS